MKFSKMLAIATLVATPMAAQAQSVSLVNCGGSGENSLVSGSSTCTVNNVVSATVPTVARMSITSTTTTLTAPLASDFANSNGVSSTGPTIHVSANDSYAITASAASATWTGTNGGSNTKPASDLRLSINGGALNALGPVSVTASGVKTADAPYAIGYNTLYNWLVDVPGTYSLQVNYTLTAP